VATTGATTEAVGSAATDAVHKPRAFSLSGRRHRRAAGERIAALFEEHGRMVYGVCRLILRDPVEAEDAAQQTFLSAYRGLLAGQEPRKASAWLGTIARNECRARLRSRSTEPGRLVREPVGDELQHDVGRREEINALCTALAELPPQQRDVIVLREFYGLSYAEVGAALGLTGLAVESLLFRSRKRLQEQLRPLRSALGVFTLPLTLRESLAQLLPGFGGGASAGAGAAALAKLSSAPVAAKVAAVTLGVGAAGTVASVETAHEVRHGAAGHHGAAAVAPVAPAALRAPTFVTAAATTAEPEAPVVRTKAVVAHRSREREHSSSGDGEHRGGTSGSRERGGGETANEGPGHDVNSSHEGSSGSAEPSHDGASGSGEPSHEGGSGSGRSGFGDSGSGSGHSGSNDSGSHDSGSGDSGSGSGFGH
jgi:RNA polymerase sigma-70 factor, ECF subfamily